jgi:hypothetical protein
MSAPDEIPADLLEPLKRLWQTEQPILIQMKPRDAWSIVGLIQFASRNPHISPTQRQLLERFGRELQRAVVAIDPVFEKYIEMGWDPKHDR